MHWGRNFKVTAALQWGPGCLGPADPSDGTCLQMRQQAVAGSAALAAVTRE